MIIRKSRIRNLELHLPGVAAGTPLVIALTDLGPHHARIRQSGLSVPLKSGEGVLPSVRGPVSRFNAEGKEVVHRDQAKETVYHQREWTRQEWHGDQQVEVTGLVDIPYQRYPRTFIRPPGVEFRSALTTEGRPILVTEQLTYKGAADAHCLHTINLLLEYFGECDVLGEDLASIINVEVQRLNWHILPEGSRPWGQLRTLLAGHIDDFEGSRNAAFRVRLDYVNSFGPTFAAVGRAGFKGYVVFGFPRKGLTFCESIYKYNATYVFDDNWEEVTRLTKTEILDQDLQKHRLIHMPGWHDRVRALLA